MSADENPPDAKRTIAVVTGHQSGRTLLAKMAAAGVEVRATAEPMEGVDGRRWHVPVLGGNLGDLVEQTRRSEQEMARLARVPTELLGEDRGPLTGDELRAIMETPPDLSHIDRTAMTGGSSFHQTRRYDK